MRAAAFAGDDLCDAAGSIIPLPRTQAERIAAGDPRLSIEERYGDHLGYVLRVARSALTLFDQRLMLWDDVYRTFTDAVASNVLVQP